ncbi:hypothetical protein I601_0973 [Nocardioides dokdonensis FR1436]|uniref:DnaJ homologue subfamily C member 28 conserved domain-containing protein n=1 Tax=Nocardioides dokdonensis FR1436 TaxID=1300347 RepID=A0A1A9GH73_9ACTN|nr:DUF1992 domain-containing protein [Nocardioides dokdonensis]ANH37416.1 hypothetical protein I601_0973 [Nocardioides dokdonensis FR1436]
MSDPSDHSEQPRRADGAPPADASHTADEIERQKRSGESAAAARIGNQALWVDQQIRVAMAQGEFDDLPGSGRPIADLGTEHDPDWWVKRLVEREQITGVLPPSLQLRRDDAGLDDLLDALTVESEARREVEDFNARVIRARYTVVDGTPPLITMPRDVEATLGAWRERRTARVAAMRAQAQAQAAAARAPRRPWWRRHP